VLHSLQLNWENSVKRLRVLFWASDLFSTLADENSTICYTLKVRLINDLIDNFIDLILIRSFKSHFQQNIWANAHDTRESL